MSDDVYVVPHPAYGVVVFGHPEDADTYGATIGRHVRTCKVLDHAGARALIEREGEGGTAC